MTYSSTLRSFSPVRDGIRLTDLDAVRGSLSTAWFTVANALPTRTSITPTSRAEWRAHRTSRTIA